MGECIAITLITLGDNLDYLPVPPFVFIALRGTTFLCTLLLFRVNFTEKVFPLKINQNMSLTIKYWARKKKKE